MPTCPECRAGYPGGYAVCPSDGATLVGELAFPDSGDHRDGASHDGHNDRGAGWPALPAEVTDPLIGTTLAGRFKVLARIGHGGMGIVYRATHAVIGREVAVKVLHERYIERREVAARLMNEAKLASAIRNEHIVDIFDFGETADGRTFVVMELLDGESLAQVLRREGALPEARALSIALQVAGALGAAHAAGIIHRDVKPENVFVSRRGDAEFVKVLDFGISKAMPNGDVEAVRLTQTGMVLGTPLYMSPEQARGEDAIDQRVDVYALGVILYECLTGETPFRGSNYLGIISDVLSRVALPPREVRPDLRISEAAERVAARAMSKDRNARHSSMAELAVDLRRALAGETIAPVPLSVTAPVPPRVRAKKRLVYLGMFGIAALATVTTAIVASRAAPPRITEAAITPSVPPANAPTVAPANAPTVAPTIAPTVAPTIASALPPKPADVTLHPVTTPTEKFVSEPVKQKVKSSGHRRHHAKIRQPVREDLPVRHAYD